METISASHGLAGSETDLHCNVVEVNLLSDHPGKVPIRRSRGETSHLSLLQCWQGCAPCHGKAFFPVLCTLNWGASSGFSACVSCCCHPLSTWGRVFLEEAYCKHLTWDCHEAKPYAPQICHLNHHWLVPQTSHSLQLAPAELAYGSTWVTLAPGALSRSCRPSLSLSNSWRSSQSQWDLMICRYQSKNIEIPRMLE